MTLKNYPFTLDPNKKGLRKILGDLEADVMEILWRRGEMTVRQVYKELRPRRNVAYTTVMTVMVRLAKKSLLNRIKKDNAFVYRTTITKDQFASSAVMKVIHGLIEDFSAPALSSFVDSLEEKDGKKMDELASLIEKKRKGRDRV